MKKKPETQTPAPEYAYARPKTECCGYVARSTSPYPVYWNPFNGVVQCHNCGHVFKPEPLSQVAESSRVGRWFYVRPWSGLFGTSVFKMQCVADLPSGGMIADGNSGLYELSANQVLGEYPPRPSFLRRLFSKEAR